MFRCWWCHEAVRARRLLGAMLGIALCVAAHAAERMLLLEVSINGQPTDKVGEFHFHEGMLAAPAGEWRELGFAVPDHLPSHQVMTVAELDKVLPSLNERRQTVDFQAPVDALHKHVIQLGAAHGAGLLHDSDNGFVLNYALAAGNNLTRTDLAGTAELRWFTPYGLASTGMLVNNAAHGRRVTRLDSSYVVSRRDELLRLRIGDFIGLGPRWSRAVRMGGVQIGTDFSLRPDLITFPVAPLIGQATVPSTVDLLVNGVRQLSRPVPAGPFEIHQLPLVTGRGEISMVVRDALGREQVQTLNYYAADSLLAPGLTAYSLSLGRLRRNYGIESNDYADLAASASLRHGWNKQLTVGGYVEAAQGMALVGGDAVVGLGTLGLLGLMAASNRGKGALLGASYEYMGSALSLGLSHQRQTGEAEDFAQRLGDPLPRRQTRAFVGYMLPRGGHVGVVYNAQRHTALPPVTGEQARTAYNTRLLSATYSAQLTPSTALFVTGFKDLAHPHVKGLSIGLSIALDARRAVSTAVTRDNGRTSHLIGMQQPAGMPGDLGWRISAEDGSNSRYSGELDYRAQWATLRLGAERLRRDTRVRAQLEGALALFGGSLFASDRIDDAFALVDTAGYTNVSVFKENRPAGRTGADGRLLVTGLRAYEANALSINALDIPFHLGLAQDRHTVFPADRSGVLVRFDIVNRRAAEIILRLPDGQPVPLGATVLRPGDSPQPVGHDGRIYLHGLDDAVQLHVQLPDLSICRVSFTLPDTADLIAALGPYPCH